ncbi:sigma-70 family RNA polymerase sigma factor [Cedecea davisae]|uniref:RNA polymerase sigma factor n=1 Tax=Cedecea davisae TaxID=158484 RepID=A0ABS6DJB5_9ENTR|nr:sigma-70 family RNA polymerase sigma factor [Cedecea davisae]MBU4682889.1 sigma-70 family RNA polymerase sigma factor [Cedecea davisae]MBU4688331.1 sigma-70 family RNA polymerase sigma factor [Cedecea davisae]
MQSAQQVAQQLYCDHQRWLYHWLRNKVGCPEHAQDLTQDTFINILVSPDLAAIRQPRPFLATVARRLVANHYRRKKLEEAWLEALATQPEQEHPDPETSLLILETLEKIDSALDGLPPHVREAFLLAHLQGMRYCDIAERLSVSSSSVKQYLQRANLHCFFALSS